MFELLLHVKKYKIGIKNRERKISEPPWNDKFGLLNVLYFVLDISRYFQWIIKIHN